MFLPTRAAAHEALNQFLPKSGADYAANRNTDYGSGRHENVSTLSPWIRTRSITEWEIVTAVLEVHTEKAASKFIDEICWRTYWKGWLQLRPSVWEDYVSARADLLKKYSSHLGYEKATVGHTGIDCFDAWANELMETGYLHNHARMWLASIWIHTLKLPWELGADWFLQHLLDGDAAANTLSWRWVAGLHTRGKSYLATAGNIRKYTQGRFEVNCRLATEPIAVPENPPVPVRPLSTAIQTAPEGRTGLLLTEEDISAADWIPKDFSVDAVAGLLPSSIYSALSMNETVVDFRRSCLRERCGDELFESIESFLIWCQEQKLQTVLLAEPSVGLWSPLMNKLQRSLAEAGIELRLQRHWWDELFYPKATHGFFRFKQAIPSMIKTLKRQLSENNHA
ncbi:MAG: FAD-binding domain-containing protein [Coraliomargaritaceae bacterium]